MPTNDQVPDEMYALCAFGSSGVPATAEPVSCDATAITWAPSKSSKPVITPSLSPGL